MSPLATGIDLTILDRLATRADGESIPGDW
jgi:hypothetical protein